MRSPRWTTNGCDRVGVEQHDLDLAAVRGVDQARRVGQRQAVVQGVAAARQHEPGVADGDGDGDARRHQQPPTGRRHDAVLTGPQIEAGIAGVGVGGQREVGVESDDRHGAAQPATLPHPGARWLRSDAMRFASPDRRASTRWRGRWRDSGLPHAVCVELARAGDRRGAGELRALRRARPGRRIRPLAAGPVINATGVLLHTNLGRAPLADRSTRRTAINVEFDLATGERGSRQQAVGTLLAMLCGAEAAMVVNNNAAAVLLVLAALARDRQVLVSRGESVEIGGGFRVPEVMEQSGARLVDVGTTNRTRLADYSQGDRPARTPTWRWC